MTDLEKLTKEVAELREEVRRLTEERQTPFHYPRQMPTVDYIGWVPRWDGSVFPYAPPNRCWVSEFDWNDPRLTAAAVIETSGWMEARAVYHAPPTITLTNEG